MKKTYNNDIENVKRKRLHRDCIITRMTTFIKTRFKKSDDQTNIDEYRVAANITEYHIISKLFFHRTIIIELLSFLYST